MAYYGMHSGPKSGAARVDDSFELPDRVGRHGLWMDQIVVRVIVKVAIIPTCFTNKFAGMVSYR